MIDDEHHEALGAMIHAMKPRDYHRENADERDRLRAEVERLTRENRTIIESSAAAINEADERAEAAERQVAMLREALEEIWALNSGHGSFDEDAAKAHLIAADALAKTEKKDG